MNFQFTPKNIEEKLTRERLMTNQKPFGFNQIFIHFPLESFSHKVAAILIF